MCGIAGAVNDTRESVIQGMLKRIQHRGPDDSGFKMFDDVCLGNVRLSIIDIEGGHQPMSSQDGQHWIVFNGEIYGYREIREQLQKEGFNFKTSSDTEVILALYEKHGLSSLTMLDGMFSFCLYDKTRDIVIIARDHFGIKPVVYTIVNNALYFASEVKAFYAIPEWKPEPDFNAWHTFLNIRFPPSPNTLFNGVKKVPPGCYIILYKKKSPDFVSPGHVCVERFQTKEWQAGIYRYYSIPKQKNTVLFEEAKQHLQTLLQKSIEKQLIADVDVGVYLSGGIDSSAIVALAGQTGSRRLNSICLGFNEPADENRFASIVAHQYNTNHRDIYIADTPMDFFKTGIYYMEEPKVNCLQGYFIAREARKYQKVMLSGLGGDELFGGYDIYEMALYLDLFSNRIVQPFVLGAASLMKQLLSLQPGIYYDNIRRGADILKHLSSPLDTYLLLRNSWDHDKRLRNMIYADDLTNNRARFVRDNFNHFPETDSLAESFMQFEIENKMVDDFLANEDRMSMAHGLEVRVPFLDRNVIEFVHSLPPSYKIRLGQRKILLRRMLQTMLPEEILRKGKHGFTFNPVLQFKKDLQRFAYMYLSEERVKQSGIFNYSFIKQIIDSKPKSSLRWHYFLLWKIVGYHLWEDVFIKGNGLLTTH